MSAMLETSTDTFRTKSPRPDQRGQDATVVLPRQGLLHELDAVLFGLFAAAVGGCDDRDAIR